MSEMKREDLNKFLKEIVKISREAAPEDPRSRAEIVGQLLQHKLRFETADLQLTEK